MSFWSALPRPLFGLSPMDGVTDACFRRLIAQQGKPDITFTEFTHVHDVCRGPEILLEPLIYSELERPVVAQLYGKDPDLFYQAAHAACELGFDGIDVNMGCPSKNVASSGSGAALIRTPDLAHAILDATRRGIADWAGGQTLEQAGFKPARIAALHRLRAQRGGYETVLRKRIPLSVKTRLGYERETVEPWIEHLLQAQPAAISLHGRTLQQMYKGPADWTAIGRAAALVKGTGTLLLGNGDVQSLRDAVRRIRETAVDGVLVGRAVLGEPWFFRDKEHARTAVTAEADGGGCLSQDTSPPFDRRFAILLDHALQFETLYGRNQFHRMRKHLGWYCKGFPHAAALRARMFRVSSVEELQGVMAEFDVASPGSGSEAGPGDDVPMPVSRCSS
jgi:tRNA-dihydrouridine synthase